MYDMYYRGLVFFRRKCVMYISVHLYSSLHSISLVLFLHFTLIFYLVAFMTCTHQPHLLISMKVCCASVQTFRINVVGYNEFNIFMILM